MPNIGQQVPSGEVLGPLDHNLFGQKGPRCPVCSGLGRVLRPNLGMGAGTKTTSGCTCKGTGIDQEYLMLSRFQQLEKHIESQQSRIITLEQEAQRLNKQLMDKLSLKDVKRSRIKNSRQYWEELIAWATADGTAVHTTTTETILFPNVTLPGNYMQDGRALKIMSFGKLSTTGTPTMTWAIRWGGVAGTLLATTEAITMGSGVATVNWSFEATIQTRSNGSTGTLFVMGELKIHTSSTAVSMNVFGVSGYDAPAAVTVDLTADTALSVTGDWSANSASNTITGHIYTLESLN